MDEMRPTAPPRDEAAVRGLDVAMASLLLLFCAPLMIVVGTAIGLADSGPIFQADRRLGRNGRRFARLKFRVRPANRLGALLCRSGLDELPQLFNIVRGDMSIVGPRPIADHEIGRYGRYAAHYSAVKPGLIGLRQLSGRDDTPYRRRIALDVAYARRKCLRLDLRIIFLAIPAALHAGSQRQAHLPGGAKA